MGPRTPYLMGAKISYGGPDQELSAISTPNFFQTFFHTTSSPGVSQRLRMLKRAFSAQSRYCFQSFHSHQGAEYQ